ncbi:protease [Bacillus sp. FJAT-27225]|uniref:glutamic-type intramembrane protease PrsW n=1 Tax=Bacillus sp. FJAT-27225 TaxID=1743144 RepID=UPI00080C267D|nr:glutamic-type intramembrane protease PrsW [Bacillus sp. FJAT-27225]OCA90953.1 protease [Bacillus sp. FJAT-27225]
MLGVFSAGIAPGLALLSYFYLKDEVEAEPLSVVLRAFLNGALLVFPIMFIQHVLSVENVVNSGLAEAFFSAGLLEEFVKWFILYYVIYRHIAFDEPFDGIVYGAAVSLGFATVENILYLIGNGVEHALGRALLPVPSHALFGVIMGFYLGKTKFSKTNQKWWLFLSITLPVVLHGIYDFILITQENWIYIITPFMVFLWWFAFRKVKKARILSAAHLKSKYQPQKPLHLQ